MKSYGIRFLVGFLLLLWATNLIAQIQIHAGLQGTWWNPARDGEGYQINVSRIGNSNFLTLIWYTYDNSGRPMYLVGAAPHVATATSVAIDMVSTSGGVFGVNFNPAAVQRTSWGSATLRFSSCTAGTVQYASPTYGSGEVSIERLGTNLLYGCAAVMPGQQYNYPFVRGDWIVSRRTDIITSVVTCEIFGRKASAEFDAYVSFRKIGSGNVSFVALIAATSSSFAVRPSNSFVRVDQLDPFPISQLNGNAATLAQTTGPLGDLIGQMMSGGSLAVRLVAENQFVAVHDATFNLGTSFPQARAAFDACVASQ